VVPPPPPPPGLAARILHRDDAVLVLDKPPSLPVHRGPRGGGPSLEDWLPALRLGKRHLPQPAHRLDADTAGCLVLGRTKPALAALGRLFATPGAVAKTYWAVVRCGGPAEEEGLVDAPLAKRSTAREGWRMVVDPEAGRPALTGWRVLGRSVELGLAWLELTPRTGRTHQLRAHCAHRGWPILGDARYGGGGDYPLHLLARAVRLPLDPPVEATAPVPPHMRAALAACGARDPERARRRHDAA
jgi:23S rRNA-/tRNA-specific pseudouridylate synthase